MHATFRMFRGFNASQILRQTALWGAALVAVCLVSCGSAPAPKERKGRIIALTDQILSTGGTDTVRFGRLGSGEIAVLQLWLENKASKPVAITSYDRTCGCTTLEFDNQPIKPGDAKRITLTFDSRGEYGWQLKVLDIKLAGAAEPLRIFVEADVK